MGERISEMHDEVMDDKRNQSGELIESDGFAETDVMQDSGDNDSSDNEEFADTAVLDANAVNSDNVGGSSVEIDVEELLAEVEAEASDGVDADGKVRRRLEAIMERKRRHEELVDFDEYDVDS
jgi:hypothetical protein